MKNIIIKYMKRIYVLPIYILINKDRCSLKIIFSITNKRAIKNAETIINKYNSEWIFDKIILKKPSNNKIIKKWS